MNRKNRWLLFGITVLLLSLLGMSGPRIAGGGGESNATPSSDLGSLSWGVERIEAPQAWERTTGSQEVVVAVIDSGIDTTVPHLAGKIWTNPNEIPGNGIDDDRNGYIDDIHGWDFRDEDASSLTGSKIHWHGTFVAGIIASVAPGIRIMDLRFLDSRNLFYGSDWKRFVAAIDYAVDNGADIINLSVYANGKPPRILEQAMQQARQHGVVVVGIAGNDGKSQVCYPAKYSSVLAVTATDREDHLASFSNYGSEVTVTAPGEKITSFFPGGVAGTSSGTSFAAPHVSGTLALILSSHPGITPSRAITLLERTSFDLGSSGNDRQFGAGLIDAGRAVASTS
ncbi:MAG: S8 family serine peptidase [Candidatus Bipolaricaulota bacterium]|nr:S8 family serine peptidase [Candidatus Bipolaricaulota bacterium]